MFNDHPEPQTATALDPKEIKYRWDGLKSLLDLGADVWWYDRNWSTHLHEPMPGISKEVWGQTVFHDVTARVRPNQRPLIMSNVEGIDIGFDRPAVSFVWMAYDPGTMPPAEVEATRVADVEANLYAFETRLGEKLARK